MKIWRDKKFVIMPKLKVLVLAALVLFTTGTDAFSQRILPSGSGGGSATIRMFAGSKNAFPANNRPIGTANNSCNVHTYHYTKVAVANPSVVYAGFSFKGGGPEVSIPIVHWTTDILLPDTTYHAFTSGGVATQDVYSGDIWNESDRIQGFTIPANSGYWISAHGEVGVATGTITTPGTLYTDGTYFNVPLTGGTGTKETATITVLAGIVTQVVPNGTGQKYLVGDTLSATAANLGGTGSGFVYTVATFQNMYFSDYFRAGTVSDVVECGVNLTDKSGSGSIVTQALNLPGPVLIMGDLPKTTRGIILVHDSLGIGIGGYSLPLQGVLGVAPGADLGYLAAYASLVGMPYVHFGSSGESASFLRNNMVRRLQFMSFMNASEEWNELGENDNTTSAATLIANNGQINTQILAAVSSVKRVWMTTITPQTLTKPISTGTLAGGTGYIDGVYTNVALTGGAGTNAKANITVSGGIVTLVDPVPGSTNYAVGNVLTTANTNLGGSGSGFTFTLLSVTTFTNTNQQQIANFVDGRRITYNNAVLANSIAGQTGNVSAAIGVQNVNDLTLYCALCTLDGTHPEGAVGGPALVTRLQAINALSPKRRKYNGANDNNRRHLDKYRRAA